MVEKDEDPLIFLDNMSLVSGLKYLARPVTGENGGEFYKPIPFSIDSAPFPKKYYPDPLSYLRYRFAYIIASNGVIPIDGVLHYLLIDKMRVVADKDISIELLPQSSHSGYFCVCYDKECCVLYRKDEFFSLLRNFLLAFAEINVGIYRDEAYRVIQQYGMHHPDDQTLFDDFAKQDEIMKTDEQRRLDVFKPEWWRDYWVLSVIKEESGYRMTVDPAWIGPTTVTVTLSDEKYNLVDKDPKNNFKKITWKNW